MEPKKGVSSGPLATVQGLEANSASFCLVWCFPTQPSLPDSLQSHWESWQGRLQAATACQRISSHFHTEILHWTAEMRNGSPVLGWRNEAEIVDI